MCLFMCTCVQFSRTIHLDESDGHFQVNFKLHKTTKIAIAKTAKNFIMDLWVKMNIPESKKPVALLLEPLD